MAKVGRASRNASLMRVETLTAAKTIASAESGELYLIDYDSAANIDITLPAAKNGAYLKFLVVTDLANASAAFTLISPGGDGTLRGVVEGKEIDSSPATVVEADDGADAELKIGGNAADTKAGSWLECVSDGTNWYVNGTIYHASGGGAVASCITFQNAGA